MGILTILNYYWYYKIIMMTRRTLGYGEAYNKLERKPSLRNENEDLALELSKFEEDDHVHEPNDNCSCEDDFKQDTAIN